MLRMGFTRITASGKIADGPVLLAGALVNVSVNGAYVSVYAAQYVNEADRITYLKGTADEITPFNWSPPIYCDDGLYVTVGDDVTEVTILWYPLPPAAELGGERS